MMKRLLFVAAALPAMLSVLAGCDPKGPPPPNPKTAADEAMKAVVATTPPSDPSLPNAAEVAAARSLESPATTLR